MVSEYVLFWASEESKKRAVGQAQQAELGRPLNERIRQWTLAKDEAHAGIGF
jgi:hypothetical protein